MEITATGNLGTNSLFSHRNSGAQTDSVLNSLLTHIIRNILQSQLDLSRPAGITERRSASFHQPAEQNESVFCFLTKSIGNN